MNTYLIHLATISYEEAEALLKSAGYEILEYKDSIDRLTVKGEKEPNHYFEGLSPNPHSSNRYVW